MRFRVDENLPAEACRILWDEGYNLISALAQRLGWHPDHDIAAICKSESGILLTLDTDFGNLLVYPTAKVPESLIRTKDQAKATVLGLARRLVAAFSLESPPGRFGIVEPNRIRVRGSREDRG